MGIFSVTNLHDNACKNYQLCTEVTIGDVANSKRPLLIIAKAQLCLHVPPHYCSFLPAEVGKSFLQVKILATAQTQWRLYSEQQGV